MLSESADLIVYGHNHCPQAQLLVLALTKHQVEYEWRDIMEGDPQYQAELKKLANGCLSVPTIILPNGTVMVEPWPGSVLKKLGVKKESWPERLLKRWFGASVS